MILLPMLHGKQNSTYGANRFFCFFVLQGSLGRTKPSTCLSVFAVKLQWNAVFRWLTEACFSLVVRPREPFNSKVRLGCFLSKVIFKLHFLHFSSFAIRPKRNAQFSICVPAHFWLILKICVSLQTYSKKWRPETTNFHLRISELQFLWPELQEIHTALTILLAFRHFWRPFLCFPCSMGSNIMIKLAFLH